MVLWSRTAKMWRDWNLISALYWLCKEQLAHSKLNSLLELVKTSGVEEVVNFNPLTANATKWSNTLKQFVGNLPTNCLSAFDHFVRLALKRLKSKTLRELLLILDSRVMESLLKWIKQFPFFGILIDKATDTANNKT